MAITWLQKGADSAKIAEKEQVELEVRKQEMGKMFRFWLKEGEEARITFVDGDLSPEGFLLPPRFYEHNLFMNGSFNNHFVCPEKTNPASGDKCPLCEGGDRPALVALFTIIDHREFKTKAGALMRDTPKLMVVKGITFEILNKIAVKRGGLANATFDVSRIGDKSASVGSMFDFIEKHDPEVLAKELTRKVKDKNGKETMETLFKCADYEHEITYRTAEELRELGLGKPQGYQPQQQNNSWGKSAGTGQASGAGSAAGETADYSDEL